MWSSKLYLGSLLALQAYSAMGADTPGVLEVDLVFPRNKTYAPSADMPIVFAIQNPHLVAPLHMRINYMIVPPGKYDETMELSDPFNVNSTSSTDLDPYYLYNNTDKVSNEGVWELFWFVEYGRCFGSPEDITYFPNNSTIGTIVFTTEKGAAKPDLVAASKEGCATGIAAWNVTSFLDVEKSAKWGGHDTCAVVSEREPWVDTDPCAIKFDAAAASKISAALNTTCAAGSDCSDKDSAGDKGSADEKDSAGEKDSKDEKDSGDENAASAVLPVGGVAWLTAIVGLTYILV